MGGLQGRHGQAARLRTHREDCGSVGPIRRELHVDASQLRRHQVLGVEGHLLHPVRLEDATTVTIGAASGQFKIWLPTPTPKSTTKPLYSRDRGGNRRKWSAAAALRCRTTNV